ncbi:flagellar hook-length control protein FliK [Chromohalobacter sp.]|uniref:flagellar hook-length control protein FliK n=1 Tax=Chromohalobacter sp. TaxID=50740 RepID=UPI001D709D5B|nr:flagellar hook-length control protein FliK [Chromohalobacter sp.]NQY46272.1 flagellar hook-length control protein FliK [Chromohalobacter sp.]
MSGINPIIDTLLHQVLGQRVDTPAARDLPEPVKPMLPGNAIEAFTQGGGLKQGGASQAEFTPTRPQAPLEQGAGLPRGGEPSSSPASAATHFSAAARTIADVLARFPAPQSSIVSSQPLLEAGQTSPRVLAAQLQQNIQQSGVFYESHLARWFKGEWSTAALSREPQMALMPRMSAGVGVPAAMPGSGAEGRAADGAPSMPRMSVADSLATITTLRPVPSASPVAGAPRVFGSASLPEAAARAEAAVPSQAQAQSQQGAATSSPWQQLGADQSETLQSVVRHQLEMLVTPTLRWEGMLWPGIMMAMTLQQWAGGERGEAGQESGQQRHNAPWHSEMNISLPHLGDVHIAMTLKAERLSLSLSAPRSETLERLSAQAEALHGRLDALGVQAVIDVRATDETSEEGHE